MFVSNSHVASILLIAGMLAYAQQLDLPYEQAVNPRIFVKVEEHSDRTMLLLQFSQIMAPEQLPTPILEQHSATGEFAITLKNISGATFFGPTNQKIAEHIPIEYNVIVPDSTQIVLRGKTAPFQRVEYVYHYNKSCYMFEIWYLPTEGKLGRTAWSSGAASMGKRNYQSYVSQAVLIAAIVLIALGLYLVLSRGRKPAPAKQDQPLAPRPSPSTGVEAPSLSVTESNEEKIKQLAREKKISYDEAALLINLNGEERDGNKG